MAVAVVPITQEQVKNLAALDTWLEVGPHYGRNAVGGAIVGGVVGLIVARKSTKKGQTSLKYAAAGAGATLLGSFLFFQVGKWAAKKEHDVLASAAVAEKPTPITPVVTKGHFAGAPRALYPTVDAHHVYR